MPKIMHNGLEYSAASGNAEVNEIEYSTWKNMSEAERKAAGLVVVKNDPTTISMGELKDEVDELNSKLENVIEKVEPVKEIPASTSTTTHTINLDAFSQYFVIICTSTASCEFGIIATGSGGGYYTRISQDAGVTVAINGLNATITVNQLRFGRILKM